MQNRRHSLSQIRRLSASGWPGELWLCGGKALESTRLSFHIQDEVVSQAQTNSNEDLPQNHFLKLDQSVGLTIVIRNSLGIRAQMFAIACKVVKKRMVKLGRDGRTDKRKAARV